ncbi:MAG: DVUA0089 family protein [Gammaproteobacteria bacterium]
MRLLRHLIATTLALAAGSSQALEVVAGALAADDDVALHTIEIDRAATWRFESYGYAGGTLSDGTLVEEGGFDSWLSLYDEGGLLLADNDDGSTRSDPNTGANFDSRIVISLAAGTYTLAVTQYDNNPAGTTLAAVFARSGDGNFTAANCAAAAFCDITGAAPFDMRTPGYVVAISVVPLPAAYLLLAPVLAGLLRRRAPAG